VQGLLPEIAADHGVGVPATGLLVTGYALGVAIGGPITTIAINRLRRKTALLLLLGVFVAGHVLGAVAPRYSWLMLARVVASLCHGAFMGVGSVVAIAIAPEHRRAAAVAMMWGGIASANILGVPVGTLIGHAFGWRATFWTIGGAGLFAAAAIAIWLPETGRGAATRLASEVKVLVRPQVLLAFALCACVCAATFSVFTYIAPLLIEIGGSAPGSLPLYLLLFGVGGVTGMQIGGRLGDRRLIATIIGGFVADFAIYVVLLIVCRSASLMAPTMFLWGFAFYFIAAPLQLLTVDTAREAPNLASTVIHTAFNFGIAVGPFVGAVFLLAGLSYALLPVCGAVLSALGVALALWSLDMQRRARSVSFAEG
jgi:MFS transporter, DHA1 family, inner membrane transport protein